MGAIGDAVSSVGKAFTGAVGSIIEPVVKGVESLAGPVVDGVKDTLKNIMGSGFDGIIKSGLNPLGMLGLPDPMKMLGGLLGGATGGMPFPGLPEGLNLPGIGQGRNLGEEIGKFCFPQIPWLKPPTSEKDFNTQVNNALGELQKNFSLLDTAAGIGTKDNVIGWADLNAALKNPNCPKELRDAINFLKSNPMVMNALDTAGGKGGVDGLFSRDDLKSLQTQYAQDTAPAQGTGDTQGTQGGDMQKMIQDLIALLQKQLGGANGTPGTGSTPGAGNSNGGVGDVINQLADALRKLFNVNTGATGGAGGTPSTGGAGASDPLQQIMQLLQKLIGGQAGTGATTGAGTGAATGTGASTGGGNIGDVLNQLLQALNNGGGVGGLTSVLQNILGGATGSTTSGATGSTGGTSSTTAATGGGNVFGNMMRDAASASDAALQDQFKQIDALGLDKAQADKLKGQAKLAAMQEKMQELSTLLKDFHEMNKAIIQNMAV